MSTRGGEISTELIRQVPPRGHKFRCEALVPGHSPPSQRGGEESAPDGSADPPEVEDGIDVVDV
ncbi:hypothetical protein A2U01_0099091, partial [Trifolium medium]|nr:hypothetical protein [Trifolium medium]